LSLAAVCVALVGCSSSSPDPTSNAPQALTTEVVCQIGPIDPNDPHAGYSTCEQYPFQWSDGSGTYSKCSDQPCAIGNACHIMGGTFGFVNSSACITSDGPRACDATSPWVWIGPSGPTSCLKSPPTGAQCWNTVNGTCRLATIN
jgi:hypothetical protein